MGEVRRRGTFWVELLSVLALAVVGMGLQLSALRRGPGDVREWLMLAERLMCIGLISFLAVTAVRAATVAISRRPLPWRSWTLYGGLLLMALVVRVVIDPVLLHVEFVGIRYVGLAVDFGSVFDQDGSYGQAGFLTQGLLAYALGGGLGAFFLANIGVSVAAIGISAALVQRWTGSRYLAPAAAFLLLGLNPLLVRTGASEDVHVVALLYALLSLWSLERYCQDLQPRHLWGAVAAGLLAACSRQFLLPMPALLVIWFVERRSVREALRAPACWALGLLAVGALVRWSVLVPGLLSGGGGAQFGAGGEWAGMARTFLIFSGMAFQEPHPLIDPSLLPPPLALWVLVGLVAIAWRRVAPRTLILAWLFLFLLSLGTPFGGIQVRYLFRFLFMHLSLLVLVLGWQVTLGWLRRRTKAWTIVTLFVLTTIVVPVCATLPTIARDGRQDPFTRQVFFLDSVLERLPEEFVLYELDYEDIGDRNLLLHIPPFLLRDHGKKVIVRSLSAWAATRGAPPSSLPAYAFLGVECSSASIFETDPLWEKPDGIVARADPEEIRRFFLAAHPGDDFILQRRRVCRADPELQPMDGELGMMIDPDGPAPGNLFYLRRPFAIGFKRLGTPR